MYPVAEAEAEAIIALYDQVTGDNYIDDETLYFELLDVIIPQYRNFSNTVEGINPETKEVRKVHENYLEGVQLQMSAFLTMLDALEKQKFSLVDEANNKLNQAAKKFRDYEAELKDLADDHKVKFEN